MGLTRGTRLGAYEILSPLGAGGMGEVYRARDTKLNRDVALKILPDSFAADPDRVMRFTREAQVLASLNHPNIAAIYGIEQSGATPALVMELVEGEDLSDLIDRARRSALGARDSDSQDPSAKSQGLPLADCLTIARQIAEALEAAHEAGIVHRDLKPANIKIKPDGTVKVLDFGLAKGDGSRLREQDLSPLSPANSPTITNHATQLGMILGTAAYMAPEQARGRAVDKRADIWAFGVVLCEMLTGQRVFKGDDVSETIASVLKDTPALDALPPSTPLRLRRLIARCLERDVRLRLRDIGEARIAIAAIERGDADAVSVPPVAVNPLQRSRTSRERLAWGVAAMAILAATATVAWLLLTGGSAGTNTAANEVARLSVLAPAGSAMNPDSTNVAISPNGRMVAFVVGTGVSTENQLWVRPLDSSVSRRIESGDGVSQPFWSPDSERIGFFADRKLKTVAQNGGAAAVVCDAPFGRGATWSASNVIVFAPDSTGPLYRVSASGGAATPITGLDAARHETSHRYPVFLPDGDHFLFAAMPGTDGEYPIFAGALHDPQARTLIGSMENAPVFAPDRDRREQGCLLFTRQGVLTAQPFDARALRLTGDATSLGDQPSVAPGPAAYETGRRVSASVAGSLAYFLQPASDANVQWMDLTGRTIGSVSAPAGRYSAVSIAPDGTKAVLVRSDASRTSSLWLVDLLRASAIPLWTGGGTTPSPVWSPDSSRIVFASEREGHRGLYVKIVTDASTERAIPQVENTSVLARSWSTDGIVFNRIDAGAKWNIYRLQPSGSDAPVPLVTGPAIEVGGWSSPDHRWLAYLSDEAGRLDLFVQALPGAGSKTQVAAGSVQSCWWTPDSRHLLYVKRDQTLWRVDVDLGGAVPRIDTPVQLAALPSTLVGIDLAPDGRRLLALVPEHAAPGAVLIVQSWQAALAAKR